MKALKTKTTNELYNKIDDILYFLLTNNKNYNKKQFEQITMLDDIFTELKER